MNEIPNRFSMHLVLLLLIMLALISTGCSRRSRIESSIKDLRNPQSSKYLLSNACKNIAHLIAECSDPVEKKDLVQIAIEPLIATLQNHDEQVCEAACLALEKIKDPRAVESLIAVLWDRSITVCDRACSALGKIKDPRAVEPLIAVLKDRKGNDGSIIARDSACFALGNIKDPRAVEPLIIALKDGDHDVRKAACFALGDINDPRAVEPLIATLGDRELDVRKAARRSISEINDLRAIEPLIVALRDEDRAVRWAAAVALSNIGGPVLDPLLNRTKRNSPQDDLTTAILSALGHKESASYVFRRVGDKQCPTDFKCDVIAAGGSAEYLSRLENAAADSGMKIAVQVRRLGRIKWDSILQEATNNSEHLDATVAALAYSCYDPVAEDFPRNIEDLAMRYIRHGDPKFVPELVQLLEACPNKILAEAYLNSGQSELTKAALDWAKKEGFSVNPYNNLYTSPIRGTWGSDKK